MGEQHGSPCRDGHGFVVTNEFVVTNPTRALVLQAAATVALGAVGAVADVLGGQVANSAAFWVSNGTSRVPLKSGAQKCIAAASAHSGA